MKVKSVESAWKEANKIFPSNFFMSQVMSDETGFPVLIATDSKYPNSYIYDLGSRIEINIEGESMSITVAEPYFAEKEFTDEDYIEMYNCEIVKHLEEKDAKNIIAYDCGFDIEKIEILNEREDVYIDDGEIKSFNSYSSRYPLYISPFDCYIRFRVCGRTYEWFGCENELNIVG